MNKIQLQEKLLKSTKYSKWYLDIIFKAQSQNRVKLNKLHENYLYYEQHHILPHSLFKEYSNLKEYKWNDVILTAKEHFICHLCLVKHYKSINYTYGERKMSRAVQALSNFGKYNSKDYQYFKFNLTCSEDTKQKMSERMKGNILSDETKTKIRDFNLGKKYSKDRCKKMSEQRIGERNHFFGKSHTDESKRKISEKLKGVPLSNETKMKMSITRKGKKQKIVECPHCDKVGGNIAMSRWHFDNCNSLRAI